MKSSSETLFSLPTTLVPIYSHSLDQDPPEFCRDSTPELIVIDLKHITELLPVIWFRKLRAQMLLYNKALVGACNPGICLEHAKAASIAIIESHQFQHLSVSPPAPSLSAPIPPQTETRTLIHHGHLRGGQAICHPDGDVVVIGNLHHGAEIMAGGHIHILGALSGRALAGTRLGEEAIISAFSLQAQLVSIAGYYLSSDELLPQQKPIWISLSGAEVIIKSYEH